MLTDNNGKSWVRKGSHDIDVKATSKKTKRWQIRMLLCNLEDKESRWN